MEGREVEKRGVSQMRTFYTDTDTDVYFWSILSSCNSGFSLSVGGGSRVSRYYASGKSEFFGNATLNVCHTVAVSSQLIKVQN